MTVRPGRRLGILAAACLVTGVVAAVVWLVRPGTSPLSSAPDQVSVLAAGDIVTCGDQTSALTADILANNGGTILALGDTVYPDGTPQEYRDCYGPTWGRFRERTRPIPGNHEYRTPGAAGYFGYFGAAAGDPTKGYYSFDLAGWHIIALNVQCSQVSGCEKGSPQDTWLRADLAASSAVCTLAMMHTPRFSSGPHGDSEWLGRFWSDLYAAGAELVLSGDDHDYEQFAPQDRDGAIDADLGIRQFVVGTGGAGVGPMGTPKPHSEAADAATHGVLKIALEPDAYAWDFIPVAGSTFSDSGRTRCHAAPAAPKPGDTLAADDFARIENGSWGMADKGGRWSLTGPPDDFAVMAGKGQMSVHAGDSREARLSIDAADVSITGTVAMDRLAPAGASTFVYVESRGNGDTMFRTTIRVAADGSVFVKPTKVVDGLQSDLAPEAPVVGLALSPDGRLGFRSTLVGDHMTFRVWDAADVEPDVWQIDQINQDTELMGSGDVGLRAYVSGESADGPIEVRFEGFRVTVPTP